jgi:hypothetical protein
MMLAMFEAATPSHVKGTLTAHLKEASREASAVDGGL